MLFALDRDTGALLALPSLVEVAAQCKRFDVMDGFWLFFDEDGSPLEARFERMNRSAGSADLPGAYTLQRPMSGLWLQERLAQVVTVSGCGMTAVADLVETLKINRGKRAAAGRAQGG